jgi:hypothetical protein
MLGFFKKRKVEAAPAVEEVRVITVQEIHDEVDGLEAQFLEEVNAILNSGALKETKEERKSKLAQELGFVNSSIVKEAKSIIENKNQLIKKAEDAELLRMYKQHYPLDKIITISMFEDVCNKYGLIIAPVENYIKDIPEKNLLELKNSKPTLDEHKPTDFYVLSNVTFMPDHIKEYQEYINSFIGKNISECGVGRLDDNELAIGKLANGFEGDRGSHWFCHNATIEKCSIKGLYVSAPPSHFNTEGLRKLEKHHVKVVGIIEEDPIVFEYLKGNLIRIKTKWGTPDDQSYLDENIVNENLN